MCDFYLNFFREKALSVIFKTSIKQAMARGSADF